MAARLIAILLCSSLLGLARPCACQSHVVKTLASCCKAKAPAPSTDSKTCCRTTVACIDVASASTSDVHPFGTLDRVASAADRVAIVQPPPLAANVATPHAQPPPLTPPTLFHLACLLTV